MRGDSGQVIGVCSWSLQPASSADLASKVRSTGVRWAQLALDPLRRGEWGLEDTVTRLGAAGITVASGMIGMKGEDYSTLESIRNTGGVAPDQTWPDNLAAARGNASVARRMGVGLVTFHGGFLPHGRGDAKRGVMVKRLQELARVFGAEGVRVGLETGQEDAETLVGVLEEVNGPLGAAQRVGVNFDPANMILYGMGDPAAAAQRLASFIVQVHVKDALPTTTPGTWGTETPAGEGAVGWPGFLDVLRKAGVRCPLMIEREGGERRVDDVTSAARLIQSAGELA
jgi:sugar phosphate isomerase/epimerase